MADKQPKRHVKNPSVFPQLLLSTDQNDEKGK